MSKFLLTHPTHGTKVALSESEVEYDKLHGWRLHTDNPKTEPPLKPRKSTMKQEQVNEIPHFLTSPSDVETE